jgi:hypothetical protein
MSIKNTTVAHFRHFNSLFTVLRSTFVERTLQIRPFYAKQSQFQIEKTNPIQSQFKPNLSQFQSQTNPIQIQFCIPDGGIEQKSDTEFLKQHVLWRLQLKTVFNIINAL